MPDSDPPVGIPAGTPTEIPPGTIAVGETAPRGAEEAAEAEVAETETFYTFTWAGRGQRRGGEGAKGRRQGGKPDHARKEGGAPRGAKGKPNGRGEGKGDGKRRGPKPEQGERPRSFSSQPQREKKIDPDNPFAAALAGFKRD